MANNIGGMLAQSGAIAGQAMGQGIANLATGIGTGVGGMLTRRQEKRREESAQEQFQQILGAYGTNPAGMRTEAQQMIASGDVNLQRVGKMLLEEANRVQEVLNKKAFRTTESVERARGRYDALKEARADTDTAFDDAVNFRRILTEAKTRAESDGSTDKEKKLFELLKTRAITPSEYAEELLEEQNKGSEAKGYKVENEIIINGKLQSVVEFFDAQGNLLNRRIIGEVAGEDADAPRGRDDWKNPEIEAYTTAVSDQRAAGSEAIKYSDLLNETLEIVGEKGQVGGFLGMARDFVIADVAGLGDAITVHRSRLNEVRMKNAIALLPRGPASDRDVKLALDASIDPKNLSPEDRIAYIRGMKKIADAEKEYMDGKLRWIEQTGDALAFGYERKVSLDGYGRQLDALRQDNSSEVAVLDGQLQQAKQLADSGNKEAAMELVEFVRSQDTIGYLNLLESQEAEQRRYDDFLQKNNITFN